MKKNEYLFVRRQLNFSLQTKILIVHGLCDFALMGAALALSMTASVFTSFLAAGVLSVFFFRQFALMHEAVHGLTFKNRRLNHIIGFISGVFCFLPYDLWKKIHLQHHYWSGNYMKDPTLEIIKRYPRLSESIKGLFNTSWKTGFPFTAFNQQVVFWYHSYKLWRETPKNIQSAVNFLLPLLFWVAVFSTVSSFLLLSMVFGIFGYLMMIETVNLPHHVGLYLNQEEMNENSHLPSWEQHAVSRSCRYPKWIETFVTLNFNYHTEHHMYVDLPWHELPKAHQLLQKSEVSSQLHIVTTGWLNQQRAYSIENFIFPNSGKSPETLNESEAA
ncbi:MAG: hypothetical protein COT73_10810 [Bdellovibrio sp. CG10_big_fil_rev_8_21_14_0_10_47_8]|nr:MAG: hypothetical protein COT73_10810 [Bdellovibrio sp. CG10_big_fil_rev_8_21_14_0_10_47_8]